MHGISIIVVLISIILTAFPPIAILGKLLLWGTVFNQILNLQFTNKVWKFNISNISVVLLLLGWTLIRSQNLYGLTNWLMLALLMFCYVSAFKFKVVSRFKLSVIFVAVIIFSLVFQYLGESYINGNIGGLITTIVSVLMYVFFPKKRIYIIPLATVTIFLYGSRSVLLSLILAFVILYAVTRLKIKFGFLITIFVLTVCFGIYTYWDLMMSSEFNSMILEKTGKDFQSGRNAIWGAIFDYMKGYDWIFGVGGGVNHQDIVPSHFRLLSLHSSYVFMLFHYGFIGLGLLWILFYRIIKQQIKKGHLYSAMFLLFFVLRDFFEITLVNNQMAIAFLFWAWIANGGLDKIFKYRNKDAINNIKDRLIAINTNS